MKSLHLPIMSGAPQASCKYAEASKDTEFLVATELGVFAELKKALPRIRSFLRSGQYADLPKYEKSNIRTN